MLMVCGVPRIAKRTAPRKSILDDPLVQQTKAGEPWDALAGGAEGSLCPPIVQQRRWGPREEQGLGQDCFLGRGERPELGFLLPCQGSFPELHFELYFGPVHKPGHLSLEARFWN